MSMTMPAGWLAGHDDDPPLPAAWRLRDPQSGTAARELVTTVIERDRDGHESEWRSDGSVRNLLPMLQATRPFTALYDGERVRITSDTRVSVDHAIARANPSMFRAVVSRGASARSTTRADELRGLAEAVEVKLRAVRRLTSRKPTKARAAAAKASATSVSLRSDRSGVILRTTPAKVTVTIGERQRRELAAECERWAHLEDVETGGPLGGPITRSWHKHLMVASVRGPGRDAKHYRSRMHLGYGAFLELRDEYERAGSEHIDCGFWHTHPNGGSKRSPAFYELVRFPLFWVVV